MSTDRKAQRTLELTALAVACALAAGAAELSAQGHLVTLGGQTNQGLIAVQPRSGAPGTLLRLAPQGLPPNTAVQVMMGALRSGFEVVATLDTDPTGRIGGRDTVTIRVPSWVTDDRAYLVMLTDIHYSPLAAADLFHPTRADGTLVRRGIVKADPSGCMTLIGEGGELYVLTGETRLLQPEADMVVKGTVVKPGACGQATTIELRSAHPR